MKCFLTYSDLTRVLYIIRFEQRASRCNQSRCKPTMNLSTDALYPQTHSSGSRQQMRVVVICKQRFSQQIYLDNSWAAIFTYTVEMNGTANQLQWLSHFPGHSHEGLSPVRLWYQDRIQESSHNTNNTQTLIVFTHWSTTQYTYI